MKAARPLRDLGMALHVIRSGRAMSIGAACAMAVLILAMPFLEIAGIALLIPLMGFVLDNSADRGEAISDQMWRFLEQAFEFLAIPFSLHTVSVTILGLVVLRAGAQYAKSQLTGRAKLRLERNLRQDLLGLVVSARAQTLRQIASGRLIDLVSQQTVAASGIVVRLIGLTGIAVTAAFYIAALIALSPAIAGLSFALAAVTGIALLPITRRVRSLSGQRVTEQSRLGNQIGDLITGWKTLKLMGGTRNELDRLAIHCERIEALGRSVLHLQSLVPAGFLIVGLAVGLGVINAAVYLEALRGPLLTAFVIMLVRLVPLLQQSQQAGNGLIAQLASAEALLALRGRLAGALEAQSENEGRYDLSRGIEFRNVSAGYDGRPVLSAVSARLPARGITVITGPSGAGKTTFVDLIARLIEPQEGEILFDGRDIGSLDLGRLRRSMIYLDQSPFLFPGTIRESLSYGQAGIDDAAILEACRKAGASDIVAALPQGLDTVIGYDGQSLSGGQMQRLTLARALLRNAPLLILDEPTSAIDFESETAILTSLRQLADSGARTILLITHRPMPEGFADCHLRLEGGSASQVPNREVA